jgi:hypothetical protein
VLYVSQVTPSQGPWGLTRVGWPHSKRLLAPLSLRRPIYSLATPPPSPLSHRGACQARSLSQCRRQTIVPRHVWAETGKKFEPTTSSSHSPSQKFNGTAERGFAHAQLGSSCFLFWSENAHRPAALSRPFWLSQISQPCTPKCQSATGGTYPRA